MENITTLSLSVSLQKDVKKRGDLKTLLVSYYKTIYSGTVYSPPHTHTHQAHKFIESEVSSAEFARWVQRTIEANRHL